MHIQMRAFEKALCTKGQHKRLDGFRTALAWEMANLISRLHASLYIQI